ncbi:hypothetical protein ACWCO0_28200 [Streptomyces tubercidicus]
MPVALERYLTALLERTTKGPEPLIDLLAVAGSGACGKYQHGWSDLDVFVIAEPDRTTELRQALIEVQSDLGEVKLGLTALLAKVLLRFDGTEQAADTDALGALTPAEGDQHEGLVRKARTDRAAAQDLAQLVLERWMATMPAAEANA